MLPLPHLVVALSPSSYIARDQRPISDVVLCPSVVTVHCHSEHVIHHNAPINIHGLKTNALPATLNCV